MRGAHVDLLFGFCADPAADNATTRERESVRSVPIKDGQLKLTIERRGRDRLPLHEIKLAALQWQVP
jgi:hypothetical protein